MRVWKSRLEEGIPLAVWNGSVHDHMSVGQYTASGNCEESLCEHCDVVGRLRNGREK